MQNLCKLSKITAGSINLQLAKTEKNFIRMHWMRICTHNSSLSLANYIFWSKQIAYTFSSNMLYTPSTKHHCKFNSFFSKSNTTQHTAKKRSQIGWNVVRHIIQYSVESVGRKPCSRSDIKLSRAYLKTFLENNNRNPI